MQQTTKADGILEEFLWVFSELTLGMLGIIMPFCRLLIFSKSFFFRKILSGTISECQTVLVQIRPAIFFGSNLGPNCLKGLLADYTSWQRVNTTFNL